MISLPVASLKPNPLLQRRALCLRKTTLQRSEPSVQILDQVITETLKSTADTQRTGPREAPPITTKTIQGAAIFKSMSLRGKPEVTSPSTELRLRHKQSYQLIC